MNNLLGRKRSGEGVVRDHLWVATGIGRID